MGSLTKLLQLTTLSRLQDPLNSGVPGVWLGVKKKGGTRGATNSLKKQQKSANSSIRLVLLYSSPKSISYV
jgi:hypothetical protein